MSLNAGGLGKLGIGHDAVSNFLDYQSQHPTNKEVCLCGHAVNKHFEIVPGRHACVTARHMCPCTKPIPVLVAQDTRYFMRKTYGYGAAHALATGLWRLDQVGKWSRFIIEVSCFKCGRADVPALPTALSNEFRVLKSPGPINVLLCSGCIEELVRAEGER